MVDYFRMPKDMWYWYRNEYKHIAPPERAKEGVAAKLKLTADKKIIANTNGTDDIKLIVSVVDKDGKQLSNSPDVTFQIVKGPGEFPTGGLITFSNGSDIYIRDGKAAIEFRSYYAGKTIIRASSQGLQSDSIVIETKGAPLYVEGVSPKVVDRPHVRYTIKPTGTNDRTYVNIAYQKPTRASSEMQDRFANKANDRDSTTAWQPNNDGQNKWWQVDLENLYTVSEVKVLFASGDAGRYTIEISKDNQGWEKIAEASTTDANSRKKILTTNNKIVGRFLRISFGSGGNKTIAINEVEVFGKTVN